MREEPHTHPVRPTLGRDETSTRARALWEELQDIARNEEAWYAIQTAFNEERLDALRNDPLRHLLDPDCTCHFDGDCLVICDHHAAEILLSGVDREVKGMIID